MDREKMQGLAEKIVKETLEKNKERYALLAEKHRVDCPYCSVQTKEEELIERDSLKSTTKTINRCPQCGKCFEVEHDDEGSRIVKELD